MDSFLSYKPQIGDLLEVPAWSKTMFTSRAIWPDHVPSALEICEVVYLFSTQNLMILAMPKFYGGLNAKNYSCLDSLDEAKKAQHNFWIFTLSAFIRKIEGSW